MMEAALSNVGGTVYFGDYNSGNGNYFVITSSDITNGNIFTWLPGGGTPKALEGHVTYTKKIKNVFLAQTITLFFNMELNSTLGNWELESEFYTSASKECGSDEGYYKTETFKISQSVIDYLNDNDNGYGGATVATLYALANDVLGGVVTDMSASTVNGAVDAINRGFDECRIQRSEPNSDEDSYPDSIDNCISIVNEDQLDTDNDGMGDVCDSDDDNDGVADNSDLNSLDPSICRDMDADGCDDCSIGTDGFGPLADYDTSNDGPDYNSDGICDVTDPEPAPTATALLQVVVVEEPRSADFKAYPVPFTDVLTIEYKYEYDTDVKIQVFDAKGMLISETVDSQYVKGTVANKQLDLSRVSDQSLIIRLSTNREKLSKQVVAKSVDQR